MNKTSANRRNSMEVVFLKLMKLFLAISLSFSLTGVLCAENWTIPVDDYGHVPADINLVGIDVLDSTGTSVFGSTTPCLLYGVIVTSDVAGNYITLRDSNTLNSTSDIKMVLNPFTIITTSNTALTGGQVLFMTQQTFPAPIIFRNGLSANLNLTPTAGGRWHLMIRPRILNSTPGRETAYPALGN